MTPDARTASLLAIRDLRVAFPGRGGVLLRAVDGLSLDLPGGQVTALIGESGSGKSVTILAILGLLPPGAVVSGRLLAGGQDVALDDAAGLAALRGRVLGAIFQDPLSSLNPVLSIGEQIDEMFRAHGRRSEGRLSWRAARRETLALLRRVGLGDLDPAGAELRARSYAHQLSGGQRQRAAIAMALAGRPQLLLADEPTSALDPTVQAQILDLLLGLVAEGTALLLVTHDLALAAETADRIAVLYAGRLLEQGPAEAVIRRPAHPYTQALLAASLTLDAAGDGGPLPGIPGRMPDPGEPRTGCVFAPRCRFVRAICRQAEPPTVAIGAQQVTCVLAEPAP